MRFFLFAANAEDREEEVEEERGKLMEHRILSSVP